jgi:hypothetical protein
MQALYAQYDMHRNRLLCRLTGSTWLMISDATYWWWMAGGYGKEKQRLDRAVDFQSLIQPY